MEKAKHIDIIQYGNFIRQNDITPKEYSYLTEDKLVNEMQVQIDDVKDLIKYCKKESREYKKELKRIDKGESNPSGEEFKKLMQNYRYSRTLENDLNDLLDTMGKEDWLLFKFHEDSLDMLDAEKLMFSQK